MALAVPSYHAVPNGHLDIHIRRSKLKTGIPSSNNDHSNNQPLKGVTFSSLFAAVWKLVTSLFAPNKFFFKSPNNVSILTQSMHQIWYQSTLTVFSQILLISEFRILSQYSTSKHSPGRSLQHCKQYINNFSWHWACFILEAGLLRRVQLDWGKILLQGQHDPLIVFSLFYTCPTNNFCRWHLDN